MSSLYTDTVAVAGNPSLMPAHVLSAPNALFSYDLGLWTAVSPDNVGAPSAMMVTAPRVPVSVPLIMHAGPLTFAYLPASYYDNLSAPTVPTAGAGMC